MTLHIADIASYQGGITLAQLRAAGFGAINVKVSHGLSTKSVHPDVAIYVEQARQQGMGLMAFHWLHNGASGAAQARYAFERLKALGLDKDAAFAVDTEDDASQQVYGDFCATMHSLLGREIITYTGDWWWKARGWPASPFSPWLHSAPAAGYLPAYPGDTSEHWAGYGPFPELAVMQYRVAPVAGIKVSQSAVRSSRLWSLMTGGPMSAWTVVPCLVALRDEFNKLSPNRDKGADGTIGDSAHTSSSDHTPDEDSDVLRDHDADSKNEVHALDTDSTGPWPNTTFRAIVMGIVARERKRWLDPNDKCRLKYVIFDRVIYSQSNNFEGEPYTGSNDPHTNHAHFSARYETECENDTRPWGVYQKEDDVEQADIDKIVAAVTAKLVPEINQVANEVWAAKTGSEVYTGRTGKDMAGDLHAFLDDYVGDAKGAAARPAKPGSLGALVKELATAQVPARLKALEDRIAAIDAKLPPLAQ